MTLGNDDDSLFTIGTHVDFLNRFILAKTGSFFPPIILDLSRNRYGSILLQFVRARGEVKLKEMILEILSICLHKFNCLVLLMYLMINLVLYRKGFLLSHTSKVSKRRLEIGQFHLFMVLQRMAASHLCSSNV